MRRAWDSYRLLLRWDFLRFRAFLPMLVTIQVLLALGVVFGMAFLIPDISPASALYLATGAPTLSLLILGMSVVPGEVSRARTNGRHDYIASLPVPRLAPLAAAVSFWLAVQLPGTVVALAVAVLRFHIGLRVGWSVAPAIALVALTAASIGYGLASLLRPQVTDQVTSFVTVALLLFSPINFPAGRLPLGLRVAHAVLPVQYMGDVVRGSLTGRYADPAPLAFAVVAAWCAAALAVGYRCATRRL